VAESKVTWDGRAVFASSRTGAVTLSHQGRTPVLEIAGVFDIALAPQVRVLADRAAGAGPAVLVVDLTLVEFLSSAGIGELVRVNQALGRDKVRVVVTGENVRRPLELTRPAAEFALYPTLPAALDGGMTSGAGRKTRVAEVPGQAVQATTRTVPSPGSAAS
jgi:anti-anti-sigma factor